MIEPAQDELVETRSVEPASLAVARGEQDDDPLSSQSSEP